MRMTSVRGPVIPAVVLAILVSASPAAPVAQGADPTPIPSAAPTGGIDFASRGVHCLECYVLWDPNANAQALLGSPPEVAGPAWLGIVLPAAGGGSLQLADYTGRPMLVELMATWCAACEAQQDAIRDARAGFPADTVIVSLDVDPAGDPAALAAYAAGHGYDWLFATATPELTRALVGDLGPFAVNPAASPVVLIGRDGSATLFALGHKDAGTLGTLLPPDA